MKANPISILSGYESSVRRKHPLQTGSIKILVWTFILVYLMGLAACNQPRDRSSYGGSESYAKVSVHVNSRSNSITFRPNNRYLNELDVPAPNGTALIVAVPAGTSFTNDYNSISGFFDKGLVDLATSTVTLTLPLNTSMELFEYTFIKSYTLNNLNNENRPVFSSAILGPITLTGSTTTVELTANLDYALEEPFDDLFDNGSYDIDHDDQDGVSYFLYEKMNWQTMNNTTYVFNPTSRSFETGTSPNTNYELVNNQWIETSGHSVTGTFDRVDRDSFTVYFTSPDFSAKLVGLIDLSISGFEGGDKGDDGDSEGDEDGDKSFMTADDFTPGALGYILEVTGMTEADYRLERIAESHDCNNTEFSSLDDYITTIRPASSPVRITVTDPVFDLKTIRQVRQVET